MASTEHNLQSLREEFGALATEVTRLMEALDQEGSDELKNRINQVRAKFDRAVADIAGDGDDAIHEFSEHIANLVEDSLRERPLGTLALAVGLGFIAGAVLRR
jgi:ElaB/YqjD/DUF883 family membrane-anchored ribosome-binding protein